MSALWATVAIVLLLLPGVGFFIGYWSQERYSREVVKSTAVGEIGMALFVAILIHLVCLGVLGWFGFNATQYFTPLAEYSNTPSWLVFQQTMARLPYTIVYILVTTVIGFVAGLILAWMVMYGLLRKLATHQWAYDLVKEKQRRNSVVATFVMTNVVENNRILMYKGYLEDFYLNADGFFTYVVLRECSRYYMTFEGDRPTTTPREPIFRLPTQRQWEHLIIPGESIANILFDPQEITEATQEVLERLDAAIVDVEARR
jgi:NADH:ubiquinone oxidoreductase subunit 5 (subunit L)/multisubunit Na+/H+ antiporter MnhA subunit